MADQTTIVQTVQADEALIKQAAELIQKKDWIQLGEFALAHRTQLAEQVTEIQGDIPLIKAGYKTTEFWLVVVFGVVTVLCKLKGISLPPTESISLGALVMTYMTSRHLTKNPIQ
jgi:hypothetical protein